MMGLSTANVRVRGQLPNSGLTSTTVQKLSRMRGQLLMPLTLGSPDL